jgi:hypothetical protein
MSDKKLPDCHPVYPQMTAEQLTDAILSGTVPGDVELVAAQAPEPDMTPPASPATEPEPTEAEMHGPARSLADWALLCYRQGKELAAARAESERLTKGIHEQLDKAKAISEHPKLGHKFGAVERVEWFCSLMEIEVQGRDKQLAALSAANAGLRKAASELLGLIDAVADTGLGDQTDRVFARYEFDDLRAAILAAPAPDQKCGECGKRAKLSSLFLCPECGEPDMTAEEIREVEAEIAEDAKDRRAEELEAAVEYISANFEARLLDQESIEYDNACEELAKPWQKMSEELRKKANRIGSVANILEQRAAETLTPRAGQE